MLHDEVTTGSATTKDWRAATKDMQIGAYWPGETPMTLEPSAPRNKRDEHTKISAEPEEALSALLKTPPKRPS